MLESLKELLAHEPFQRFKIVLTSGTEYEVAQPFLVAVGESQIFYCYPHSDRLAYIRVNQIAAIETRQAA